ncbi:MAG: PHP domain-containing protein [Planctomycetes bacterium]|nr:PHP domain-containing protein [Planctomycetota bacterium]
MPPREDYHLHTTCSDGDFTPEDLLHRLAEKGVRRIAITDHDTVGAYLDGKVGGWEAIGFGRRCNVEVITGIEMDAEWHGVELHMLGYDFQLQDAALRTHLETVREQRESRIREQIELINRKLGEPLLDAAKVFLPGRFTVMSPHLIRVLLAAGLFDGKYGTAKKWLKEQIPTQASVAKPTAAKAVQLIRAAGGRASLAHPGFYMKEAKLDLRALLVELKEAGLWGVEVAYPYIPSGIVPDAAAEQALIEEIGAVTEELELSRSFGTDVHSAKDFEREYGK